MFVEYEGSIPKRCLYCGGLMIENVKHTCITHDMSWSSNRKEDKKVEDDQKGFVKLVEETQGMTLLQFQLWLQNRTDNELEGIYETANVIKYCTEEQLKKRNVK